MQQEHSAHSHNGGARQTPGARNATWPLATTANPGVTPTTLQHQRCITHLTVKHCAAESCTALLLRHPKSLHLTKTPHTHHPSPCATISTDFVAVNWHQPDDQRPPEKQNITATIVGLYNNLEPSAILMCSMDAENSSVSPVVQAAGWCQPKHHVCIKLRLLHDRA